MTRFKSRIVRFLLLVLFLASIGVYAFPAPLLSLGNGEHDFGRNDLWHVVKYVCVPLARIDLPFPCASVHSGGGDEGGWAVLPVGKAHILTVPTDRLTGIESPLAQGPAAAHYWQAAWDAHSLVERDIGHQLPREAIGLAINSAPGRSQDQFHIHTACIQPTVQAALARDRARIGTQWVRLHTELFGSSFMVRRLDGVSLEAENVIDLLPPGLKSNRAAMARQTLVVVGATLDDGRDGFYVLNTQAGGQNPARGEALLDFACRLTAYGQPLPSTP